MKNTEEVLKNLGFVDPYSNEDKLEFLKLWETIQTEN